MHSQDTRHVQWNQRVEEFGASHAGHSSAGPSYRESAPSQRDSFTFYQQHYATDNLKGWPGMPPTPVIPSIPLPSPTRGDESETNIHPWLAAPMPLDLSISSEELRLRLGRYQALLDTPACFPQTDALFLRVDVGHFRAKIEVRSHRQAGAAVTIGDVLTTLHAELRRPDGGSTPSDALAYTRQRMAVERSGRARMVDHLLGQTWFAGLYRGEGHWNVRMIRGEQARHGSCR
ncbi:unnamed protein product [Mycena citricolor]|uniref:DUF6699 domain-containing protein n=1 Tax=Mycena citricolor TaxID=2018698 RepID=A0AAD2HUJ2_9AGAR|nr:unnamed protein product [Mycena citricolor]